MALHKLRGCVYLLICAAVTLCTALSFLRMRRPEALAPGVGVTRIGLLSDYFAPLKNTRGDTEVYICAGDSSGAAVLILGGSHPNEPAGFITAVCLIENITIRVGKVLIIPRANNSGFTHNDPQEGSPQRFAIETDSGARSFRYGSRVTNPVDQWPDPEVYQHFPSGQKLSGAETRNLNRAYPGRADGSLTEKVAFAIMQLMREEQIDLAIDLHEASLEYPVINALVAHPLAFELAAETVMYLQMEGITISLEPSPENFHGLSHREWGDHIQIPAILMESANVMQGRYHGRVTAEVILNGRDKFYREAAAHGLLEVEYPEEGIPLEVRVGRHLATLQQLFSLWNAHNPGNAIVVENIPGYYQLQERGIGAFLH